MRLFAALIAVALLLGACAHKYPAECLCDHREPYHSTYGDPLKLGR